MLGLRHYLGSAIDIFQGDITCFVCDVMVNAASPQLRGGEGVDGAIHLAAGPSVLEELKQWDFCPHGSARMTGAGNLPCRALIHAVGPIWQNGQEGEADLLRSAYRESLGLAATQAHAHVALPSLSTGTYGYPLEEAAFLALRTVREFCQENSGKLRRISFVLFDRTSYLAYQKALFEVFPEKEES